MILMNIEPTLLVIHVVIVSLSTLGIVEYLKNYIKPKKKKTYAVLGLVILCLCVLMQMPFINPITTTFWNLFALGISLKMFGHTALVKVPEAMMNKTFGIKEEK